MKYLVCEEKTLKYSKDYCDALLKSLDLKYLLYNKPNQVTIKRGYIYIFRLIVPEHLLTDPTNFKNFYVINTEQLTKKIWFDKIKHYSDIGIKIITYDHYQSLALPYLPIYLPYPINNDENQYLSNLVINTPKEYDVVFCTANSEKRIDIFERLKDRKIKVIDAIGWGNERDEQIAKAKILINIHYDDTYNIFEHIRCDRWIMAGQMIITEESLSDASLDIKNLLIIDKYENLIDKIVDVINKYDFYYNKFKIDLQAKKHTIVSQRSQIIQQFSRKLNTRKIPIPIPKPIPIQIKQFNQVPYLNYYKNQQKAQLNTKQKAHINRKQKTKINTKQKTLYISPIIIGNVQ